MAATTRPESPAPAAEVVYPESDGKPMAETTDHRDAMIETLVGLRDWFADDPLAYISGNEILYFVEGNPRRNASPDVWIARGIDKMVARWSYKTWPDDGKGPDFVLEATSKSTRREDLNKKYRIDQDDLKVREYFLFDPLDEYLRPRLRGHRLVVGAYQPIEPVAGRLPSLVLGLHLEGDGVRLRLFDPVAGQRLPDLLETIEARREEARQRQLDLDRERDRVREQDQALRERDAEIDRLRRELASLRGAPPAPTDRA